MVEPRSAWHATAVRNLVQFDARPSGGAKVLRFTAMAFGSAEVVVSTAWNQRLWVDRTQANRALPMYSPVFGAGGTAKIADPTCRMYSFSRSNLPSLSCSVTKCCGSFW